MPILRRTADRQRALGAQGLHVVARTAEVLDQVVANEEREPEPPPRYTDEQRARARERIERGGTVGLMDVGEIRMGRAHVSYTDTFKAIREGRLPEVKK